MVVLEEDKCAQVCGFNDRECRRMPVCKFRPAYEAAITAQSLTSSILQAMNERHTSDGVDLAFAGFQKGAGMAVRRIAGSLLTCQ